MKEVTKWDVLNHVSTSTLKADDKNLLVELVARSDDDWFSWPSVERLCQVRGIKHEKNFKGADAYLAGLVTKEKRGRKNTYTLNVGAIMALPTFQVSIKHTPAAGGLNTPAVAESTPAVADNSPAAKGANSTKNNTSDSSIVSTPAPVASAPNAAPSLILSDKKEAQESTPIDLNGPDAVVPIDSTSSDTPSAEGLSQEDVARAERNRVKATKSLTEHLSMYGCYETKPATEDEFSAALELMLDNSFANRTTYWPERASKAMAEVRPLVW